MKQKTYFISGHRDVTGREFFEHYVPRIEKAIQEEANFVVSDYEGVDELAQLYLSARKMYRDIHMTVYHMTSEPRCNHGNFLTRGNFQCADDHDTEMTWDSDEDIAWIRPGKEESCTAKNLERRMMKNLIDEHNKDPHKGLIKPCT